MAGQPNLKSAFIPVVFALACVWSAVPREVAARLVPSDTLLDWLVATPPKALTLGIILALAGWTTWTSASKRLSRTLIQISVVLLGLRMDLRQLGQAAIDGLGFAVATIAAAMLAGLILARIWKTGREIGLLVTSGTAICGGSAIAAVGGAIGASSSAMAVATGAIFLLNAAGLYLLPLVGHWAGLSEIQYGTWAGVALHDIASVAGAGKAAGPVALETAMVVKLVRVIWIAPIAVASALVMRRLNARRLNAANPSDHSSPASSPLRTALPWFIGWFVLASLTRTLVPAVGAWEAPIKTTSAAGFQLALFLIGAGLSRDALAKVGWRAFALATSLWVLLAGFSLAAIRLAG